MSRIGRRLGQRKHGTMTALFENDAADHRLGQKIVGAGDVLIAGATLLCAIEVTLPRPATSWLERLTVQLLVTGRDGIFLPITSFSDGVREGATCILQATCARDERLWVLDDTARAAARIAICIGEAVVFPAPPLATRTSLLK
jgi:hypothetical protein